MKKDGFTLIEILLVIVIIASISSSAFIVFSEVNDSTEIQSLKNLYASIQRAGKTYVDLNDNWTSDFNDMGAITISLSALQNTNYISENLVNPIDNTKIPSSYVVKICLAPDSVVNVSGTNINSGRFVDTCIMGVDNVCIADSTGEYVNGKMNCNSCCNN